MPNHVRNEIEINGSLIDIMAVRDFMNGEDNPFDFNKIAPIPEELEGTRNPTRIISQVEYDKQEAEIRKFHVKVVKCDELTEEEFDMKTYGLNRGITQDMSDRFIEELGFNNWYDWYGSRFYFDAFR